MKIEKININDLTPVEDNIRRHTAKQIAEFTRSLEMFGQFRPVVIDENNVVLAGNGMVMALSEMGIEEADCVRYTELSDGDKKKLMIADNQIFELGLTDSDMLFKALEEVGDFDVPGFDEESLKRLVGDAETVIEDFTEYGLIQSDTRDKLNKASERKANPNINHYQEAEKVNREKEEVMKQNEEKGEPAMLCPHCQGPIWL